MKERNSRQEKPKEKIDRKKEKRWWQQITRTDIVVSEASPRFSYPLTFSRCVCFFFLSPLPPSFNTRETSRR